METRTPPGGSVAGGAGTLAAVPDAEPGIWDP